MKSTRVIRHEDGRREVLWIQPPRENCDEELKFESSIIWLEDFNCLPFVRAVVSKKCKTKSGALDAKGTGRVVGYSNLCDDASRHEKTRGYVRRIFFLSLDDLNHQGTASSGDGGIPQGVLDPTTIFPGFVGHPPGHHSKDAHSETTQSSDRDDEDDVLEWLGDWSPGQVPQSQIDTELAHDEPIPTHVNREPGEYFGKLIPLNGGSTIDLTKRKLSMGRMVDCDIVLTHEKVSGLHCELQLEQGYWFIKDMNSRNGVKVDGLRLEPLGRAQLHPNALVTIAGADYEIQYSPNLLSDDGIENQRKTAIDMALSNVKRWDRKQD